jgi:hypothetical protein
MLPAVQHNKPGYFILFYFEVKFNMISIDDFFYDDPAITPENPWIWNIVEHKQALQ